MGSLFAGIGGFDLGFERAGFKTAWQVEIDPYCQKVLAKNFPEAERFGDIRECGRHNLKPVDVICGGFPCQDISNAGKRAGIEGERSGLWSEMHRIICELRPRFTLIENVAALVSSGLDRVLCDLAKVGLDVEWEVVAASDMGAPHRRERVWLVAYSKSDGWQGGGETGISKGMPGTWVLPKSGRSGAIEHDRYVSDSDILTPIRIAIARGECRNWPVEPDVGRVAHGVPKRVDRLRGLGNAVVPQIPEMIARRIKQALDGGNL